MADLQSTLQEVSDLIEEKMDILLPVPRKERVGESRLAEAMRYTALSGGKRLRPFLVVESARLFGVSKSSALQVAAAMEFIHAYSLIHDDLPAMDDDDTRRGQPSSHVRFDEATAILAGDALLTFAFEVLSDPGTHADTAVRIELVNSFARASGVGGMVGGQMMDLVSGDHDMTIQEITRLQRMKTGALFAIACESGAILGKAPVQLRHALRGYAHDIGLAFQITDDILDAESLGGDEEDDRHDKSSGKATYVSSLGIEKTRMQTKMLCEQAKAHLKPFGKEANLLKELADFVVTREQ